MRGCTALRFQISPERVSFFAAGDPVGGSLRMQAHVLPVHAPQEEVGTPLVQVAVLGIQPDKPARPDARADELCRVVSIKGAAVRAVDWIFRVGARPAAHHADVVPDSSRNHVRS